MEKNTTSDKQRSWPKISIVTPSYNQAKFLERTILTVLNQNFPNLEYIITDGGSTDGSVAIIKKYEKYLTHWVSEPDNGQSDAINKGFAKATGAWLCWVNADDVLFPGALEKVARCASKCLAADIITGNVIYIDENDSITRCVRVPRQNWLFYRYGVGFFAAPAIFFRKSLFDKVGGLDVFLHYSMDIDLFHKFLLANARVCHISSYLGGFRFHTASKTITFRGKDKNAFENPETTIIRMRYIPKVSKAAIRLFRLLHKLLRTVNFNLLRGWLDSRRTRGMKWQQVFK
jgi:glycosyltransferase involved in cell wall biosynthesis